MSKIAVYLLSGIAVLAVAGVAVYMLVLAPKTPSTQAPAQPGAPTAAVPGKPTDMKKEEPKGGMLGNFKVDFESTIFSDNIQEAVTATSKVRAQTVTLAPSNGTLSGSSTLNYLEYDIVTDEGDCTITENFENSTFYVRQATLSENMDDLTLVFDFDEPKESMRIYCLTEGGVIDRTVPIQNFTAGFNEHHMTDKTLGGDGWLIGTGWTKGTGDVLATWSVNRKAIFDSNEVQEVTTITIRRAP